MRWRRAHRASRWRVFDSVDYRFFIAGTALANMSQWMQQFALGWLVVELAQRDGLDATSAYVALLGLARLVPALALGLLGGVAADQVDRRRLLIATRLASSVIAAVMAAVALASGMSIGVAVALTSLAAAAVAFDQPARLAMSPTLVPPEESFAAISITRSTMLASSLIGPLVGGLLIGPLGTGGVLVACAGLFAASGLGLRRIRSAPRAGPASVAGPVAALVEVTSYVRSEPILLGLMPATIIFATFANSYPQLLPAIAHDSLHVGAVELSWLTSAAGLGGFLGAMTLSTMGSWPRLGWILLTDALLIGAFLLLLGLQRQFGAVLLVTGTLGAASMIYFGGIGNVLQLTAPDALRGRVMAAHGTAFQIGAPLGTLVLGSLATVIGISNALLVAGLVIVVTTLSLWRIAAARNVDSQRLMAGAVRAMSADGVGE